MQTLPNTKLKMELWKRRLKQIDLCLEVGIDPARFSKILNGREEPTPEIKRDIAKYLGKEETELF